MKTLPESDAPLFIRTDFEDSDGWDTICSAVQQPVDDMTADFAAFAEFNAMIGQDVGDGLKANLSIVDDPAFTNFTPAQLIERLPSGNYPTFFFVADRESFAGGEHSVLVVDAETGQTFRSTPEQVQSIENNLSISNMDFDEFADAVDSNGVFRGF